MPRNERNTLTRGLGNNDGCIKRLLGTSSGESALTKIMGK
jgi:hypothetical protein